MPARDYYLPSRRLVSQDDASMVESARVPRSKFVGQWSRKTTFDAGYLVPFLVDEILPGDHMRYEVTAYVRLSTPLFPIFDNQRIDTFFFFVPCRLVWDHWVNMMGEQPELDDPIDYTVPQILRSNGAGSDRQAGSVYDAFGIPDDGQVTGDQFGVNALPFRAYNLIYNQWFRDQNSIQAAVIHKGDANDPIASYPMRRRAKSHDYFTSALPWPQKFTAPNLPLSGMAPVLGLGAIADNSLLNSASVGESNQASTTYAFYKQMWDAAAGNQVIMKMSAAAGTPAYPAVFADLSAVSGISINILRNAWLVQSLLERDARGGTRYVELIRSHFGVTNPDFRLQRPEYIGGGQTALQITPIAQTAPSEDVTVGALGAAGTAAGSHSASYAATEHGYVIGLINVKTELSYQQGLHKMWSRLTRLDFYVPSLAGLGEQAILRKELYLIGTTAVDELVFGYQERWHEYRTRYSEVTGMFKSGITGTLDAWHLAQDFGSPPVLGATFLEDTPPMARVLAAAELTVKQQYLADILINRTAVRPIPTFGTPVQLGRF